MYIGEGTEVDVIDVFSPESEDDTSETLQPARTVMTTGSDTGCYGGRGQFFIRKDNTAK